MTLFSKYHNHQSKNIYTANKIIINAWLITEKYIDYIQFNTLKLVYWYTDMFWWCCKNIFSIHHVQCTLVYWSAMWLSWDSVRHRHYDPVGIVQSIVTRALSRLDTQSSEGGVSQLITWQDHSMYNVHGAHKILYIAGQKPPPSIPCCPGPGWWGLPHPQRSRYVAVWWRIWLETSYHTGN